ncbi:MAG: hypothetical protein RLZZ450_491 [Pseudomonadota bacterium]|jgi:hypothetical protein
MRHNELKRAPCESKGSSVMSIFEKSTIGPPLLSFTVGYT